MEDGFGATGNSNDETMGASISSVEQNLLQQFQCLATDDKDVLINEFKRFLNPNQLSDDGCIFFLEMSNWNLQKAICAYFDFDFDSPKEYIFNPPIMTFLKDVTIGEGEEVPPNTKFIKTWKIQNSGKEIWPVGCVLNFIGGDQMTTCRNVFVGALAPGETTEVSVEMISPSLPGIYQGQWRMSTINGQYFGEIIWVIITVAEGGLLGLTQQMSQFHSLGSPVKRANEQVNPFAQHSIHNNQNITSIDSTPQTLFSSSSNNVFSNNESPYRNLFSNNNQINTDDQSRTRIQIDSEETHLPPTPPLSDDMML